MNYLKQAQPAVIATEALLDFLNGSKMTPETGRNLGKWIFQSSAQAGRLVTRSCDSVHSELLHLARGARFGTVPYYFPHRSSAEEEGVRVSFLIGMGSIKSVITGFRTPLASFQWAESSYHEALSALATTEDNWDDCGGNGPSAAAVATTTKIAKRFDERGVPDLALYPAPEGGVDVQWRTSTSLLIVEILSDGNISAVRRVSGFSVETSDSRLPDDIADWAIDRDQREG